MSTRRPVLVERAALVGLVTGGARRVDAEHSLEELGGLAEAAGARVVLRVLQDRPKPDSATFLGSGKVEVLAHAAAEADADLIIFDNELSPGAVARAEQAARSQGRRSHAADPRHLREAGADARRQAAGRAGAIEVPAAAAGRIERGAVAPGRRHRHERPRRNETRSGSPAHPRADEDAAGRDRSGAPAPHAAARAPPQGRRADGGAGRLYQRRQDHAVQSIDAVGRRSVERAVRDARSAGPARRPARPARAAAERYGRLHRSPAAHAGRGVSRHARRNRRRRSGAARDRCRQSGARAPHGRRDPRARRGWRDGSAARRGLQQGRSCSPPTNAGASRKRIRRRC